MVQKINSVGVADFSPKYRMLILKLGQDHKKLIKIL